MGAVPTSYSRPAQAHILIPPAPSPRIALFPYPLRPHQGDILQQFAASLAAGRHIVAESGTGTGKTVTALSAALEHARASGRRVLYLTRTNSQARQVMVEYRAIRRAAEVHPDRAAVALQGRHHLCPLRTHDAEVAKADGDELGVMCRDRMRAAEDQHLGHAPRVRVPACPYHLKGLHEGSEPLLEWAREEAPDAEAFAAHVVDAGQCPHVLSRVLLGESELVVAPYVYLFHPHLRAPFLRWMNATLQDLIVIVDEAHNLPDYARELATPRLSVRTLEQALGEARQFGDPTVLGTTSLTRFLHGLLEVLAEVKESYLDDESEDALLPPDEFDMLLLSTFRTTTPSIDRALTVMEEYAAAVRESRRKQGRVPRSHVGTVAAFLRAYRALDAGTHVPLVERDGGESIRLVAFALDPSIVTGVLADAAASIHMSGTLAPLEEYRDTIGLDPARTSLACFPSPFPKENRLVVVDETVTTRHEDLARDPGLWHDIAERLRELRASTDRNMAVFLPSYETLHRLAPALQGRASLVESAMSRDVAGGRRPGVFVEARGESQESLMRRLGAFKASKGGTLVSVIGGRLSEGLDFPDDELELVVIVGLPYAKPTAKGEALVRFYDRRFGRGWEWAVKVPMMRRILQAAGRLIRTPTDRGVVVLLDRRAATLREAFPDRALSDDPVREVRAFFRSSTEGSYGGGSMGGRGIHPGSSP
ncbi:MAG TPA: ATP-dependent DNA helicase [Candidatus Thermoplasmatota archaeon]|nr:ATP-dependent DNA helicase [Candidatus Thermoplasmatota archaeon]